MEVWYLVTSQQGWRFPYLDTRPLPNAAAVFPGAFQLSWSVDMDRFPATYLVLCWAFLGDTEEGVPRPQRMSCQVGELTKDNLDHLGKGVWYQIVASGPRAVGMLGVWG